MTYKPFDLTGKVALVTGGNGGIGLGMAEALAHAGADIAIWGTNADKNAAAEATLKAAGRRVLAQTIDVANEAQVVEGMKAVVGKLGRIDAVFANAGIGIGSVRHESWRDPAGESPAQVGSSVHLVASVATWKVTTTVKRTQQSCGVG